MPRKYQPVVRLPRLCTLPGCGNSFIGQKSKRYCSTACNLQHLKEKGRTYYKPGRDKAHRARRFAADCRELPRCTICNNSTARKSVYSKLGPKRDNYKRVPEGVHLCKRHFKGLVAFVVQNRLHDKDKDEVFAAFLVRLTFSNSDGIKLVHMMREAFHAGSTG